MLQEVYATLIIECLQFEGHANYCWPANTSKLMHAAYAACCRTPMLHAAKAAGCMHMPQIYFL
jgi:hypothetical protein